MEHRDNSEPFYRSIFNESREPKILIDPETGILLDANIKASSLFTLQLEDLVNKNIIEFLKIHADELILDILKIFAGSKDFFVYKSDGNRIFQVYPSKCSFHNKKLLCLTFFDITDLYINAKNLEFFKDGFEFLLNETGDIVFLTDKEGNILNISKKALMLSAVDHRENLIGKNLFEVFFIEKDLKEKILKSIQAKGFCRDQEAIFTSANQNKINLILSVYSSHNEKDDLIIYASKKEDSQCFEKKSNLFMLKMEAIEQIAKGVAHEFNNILSGVIGFAELLKMHIGHDLKAKSYIDKLLFSANRGAQIVKDINTFSQRSRSVAVLLDINKTIKEFKNFIKEQLNSNVIIELDLAPKSLTVMADPNQIKTVLLNLFSNSNDALGGQGVIKISTELFDIDEGFREIHGFGVPGRYVLISFTDSGGGIDEKIIDRIFEPFFTIKDVGKGTGLGLSIVYGIVKQHNGYITVSSKEAYTTFRIYLPYLMRHIDLVNSSNKGLTSFNKNKVLVFVHNEVINTLIKDILEGSGYEVIQAINEEEVSEILKNNDKIDVIIIDSKVPQTIGSDIIHVLKAIKPEIKIIFLNGHNHDILSLNFQNSTEGNISRKSFSAATLLEAVKESFNINTN